MGLDLYGKIEPLLGFEEEKQKLYEVFLDKLSELGIKNFLDIGCGSGAFMQLAKNAGFEPEGIDVSRVMVERAKKAGLQVYHGDICQLDRKYEAATAVFDVINYLDKEELAKFFVCVKNLLKKGGYFICDMNTLYGFEEIAQGSLIIDNDEQFVAIDAEFADNRLITKIYLFEKRDSCYKKEAEEIVQYYHEMGFLKKLGLELIDIDFISLYGEEADKVLMTWKGK
ncbi:class I SAM-dependent DNA methyltransferase [Nitratiruptor tergarcus]|uniref:Methyltransferase domain-containing protein n=1 Tax=Nitratiruptor tergarcus DSM 16512 TaxID=1069081 RepID=A0A1W1WSU0_9BACT|nr:class I SAM-dependent methyltransferase [Nitratiruptor tergarcus]SMC09371.1 Methyltransferase domain-containing protein [Nitratiruptor tergarcus DSM 16512]